MIEVGLTRGDAVTITFGAPAGISHNNIGGRNSDSDKWALIDKVGTYDGQDYNLKLTSALANGDDSNCRSGACARPCRVLPRVHLINCRSDAEAGAEAACRIAINSASGTVDFFIRKKKADLRPRHHHCPRQLSIKRLASKRSS